MTELKKQVQLTMTLGVLSLFAGVMGHLALTDIYHGNGNLSLEWNVLRACAVVLVVFIGSTLFTLRQVLKRL
ncbi:MAG TPA: hypothetical protein VI753_03315 [Anaerolineales bacterium]|jgi:hypothetical protein|nr:hypothetical protein [Anaerolineales bacterium]